jgi:hypothetical protein
MFFQKFNTNMNLILGILLQVLYSSYLYIYCIMNWLDISIKLNIISMIKD